MTDVEAAKKELSKAQASQTKVLEERQKAEAAVAALSEEIAATDPDDEGRLAKLVSKRDAARGRLEALGRRVQIAGSDVELATAALAAAELTAKSERIVELRQQMRAEEVSAEADAKAAVQKLAARARKLGEIHSELISLGAEVRKARGEDPDIELPSAWQAQPGAELLQANHLLLRQRGLM